MSAFSTRAGAFLALFVVGCGAADDAADRGYEEPAHASQIQTSSTLDIPVTVRGTGTATLKNNVYSNPSASASASTTILSVPGLGATGRVFEPLTQALLADAALRANVKQAITLDLPGHGQSTLPAGLPAGIKYGDLTLDDHVDIVVQTIEALQKQGSAPALVVSHGVGALYVAAAQQKLLDRGSSLSKLGVRRVLFYAPVPSHGRPWTQPAQEANVNSFFASDATAGTTYKLTPEAWTRQNFTTRAGTLAPTAPAAADLATKGWIASEPLGAVLQLTETAPPAGGAVVNRPTVNAGVFAAANGTQLITVAFAENNAVSAADVTSFHQHLSGDTANANLVTVEGPDAVSSAFITSPGKVLESTRKFF
jgi:pimeloyl-ACP methyl ester carboxylesterase